MNRTKYVDAIRPVAMTQFKTKCLGAYAVATTKTRDFQKEDTVTFEDRNGWNNLGVVVRFNQRTATIGTGDSGSLRVPSHML